MTNENEEYLSVERYAEIRNLSPALIKRRIYDGTIQNIQTEPSRAEGQVEYKIHCSELYIPRKDLLGRMKQIGKASYIADNYSPQLLAGTRQLRRILDELDLRLKIMEQATSNAE